MIHPEFKLASQFKLPMGILAGSIVPGGGAIVAGCMDGVYAADLESKEFQKLYDHGSYVSSVHCLHNGQIVSAGYDGVVQWYDRTSRQVTRTLQLHQFWSWDMAISPDQQSLVSVTGQYLADGYKYEPMAEREPSIQIVALDSGDVLHRLSHVPPVQAVAFSPDGRHVAAGNLMGQVRIYDTQIGQLANQFTTDAFTSWGIIKSHSYIGGIFAMQFTPDGEHLLLAGMGQMRDPMAANGRQLWQRWSWREPSPKLVDQTHDKESGEGLMETLAIDPAGEMFLMGGRLRGGDWSSGVFSLQDGSRIAQMKNGFRVTEAEYSADGKQLIIFGAQGQPKKRDKAGNFPHFGRVQVYDISG